MLEHFLPQTLYYLIKHLNHATQPHRSFKCQCCNDFAVKHYRTCMQQKFKFIMALAKAKVAKFESYQQKFRSEWLLDKKFKKGFDRTTTNEAYCKWCRTKVHPRVYSCRAHNNCFPHRSQYPNQGNRLFVLYFAKDFSEFSYYKGICMQENQTCLPCL